VVSSGWGCATVAQLSSSAVRPAGMYDWYDEVGAQGIQCRRCPILPV
jgi:hypothetical protein